MGRGVLKAMQISISGVMPGHNAEVAAHFKNRRNDLLVLRIGRNAGWDKLCSFLDIKAPSIAFPHENRAEERDKGN